MAFRDLLSLGDFNFVRLSKESISCLHIRWIEKQREGLSVSFEILISDPDNLWCMCGTHP